MRIVVHYLFICCVYIFYVFLFFFFKQKTAYDMRISDWSSDVCSSDLILIPLCRRARDEGSRQRGMRMRDLTGTQSAPAYGGRTAIFAVAVLTMVSFFNYMDRMVLAVVLEPMKHELGLSDSALGLLSGVALAVVHSTMGIPLRRPPAQHRRGAC